MKNTVIMCQFSSNSREYMREKSKKSTNEAFLLWHFPNWMHIRLCVQAVIYSQILVSLFSRVVRMITVEIQQRNKYIELQFVMILLFVCLVRLLAVCEHFTTRHISSKSNWNAIEKYQSDGNFNSVLQIWVVVYTPKSFIMFLCFALIRSVSHCSRFVGLFYSFFFHLNWL